MKSKSLLTTGLYSLIVGLVVCVVHSPGVAGTELLFANKTVRTDAQVFAQPLQKTYFAGEYIIQFQNRITENDKNSLKQMGMTIHRYLPEDALIVSAPEFHSSALEQNRLQVILPYKGDFKLSTAFPQFSVFSQQSRQNILITTFQPQALDQVWSFLTSNDPSVRLIEREGRALAVRLKSSLIPKLSEISSVEFVEPINPMVPMHMNLLSDEEVAAEETFNGDYTDLTGFETGTKVIRTEALWGLGFLGSGQIVAMADTGLDSGDMEKIHPDFAGSVKTGYSFGAGAKSWSDPMGHGTHVAGSVMGRGTASGGKLMGAAPKAGMLPQGMWSPIIENLTVPPKLNKLFDSAYADGAKFHTNSWGSAQNFGAYDSMAQQVDEFSWNNQDFLILFAAGNSGVDKDKNGVIDPGSVSSPGTAKNALTVGASENFLSTGGIQRKIGELKIAKENWPAEPIFSSKLSDNENGVAMFSSRGPTRDGRTKPEVVAPGTNILSVKSSLLKPEDNFWGGYSKDYIYSGGTSMATPLVAGAAAVTREFIMQQFKIEKPSAALVKAMLMHSAFDMYPGQYGNGPTQELKTPRPNSDQGYGRVDLANLSSMSELSTKIVDSSGVGQGEVYQTTVDVPAGKTLLVNLVYMDAPGTAAAAVALVNNLDLVVQDQVSDSKVNNHEMVEIKNASAGTYKIEVKGTNVPMGKTGKQPFALVYSVL